MHVNQMKPLLQLPPSLGAGSEPRRRHGLLCMDRCADQGTGSGYLRWFIFSKKLARSSNTVIYHYRFRDLVLWQAFLDQRGEDFAPDSERSALVRPLPRLGLAAPLQRLEAPCVMVSSRGSASICPVGAADHHGTGMRGQHRARWPAPRHRRRRCWRRGGGQSFCQ